jgi:transcriptional regulator with XRE-family HTH domain
VNALSSLWGKLSKSKKYREAFVAAQLKRGIPTQLRVLLKQHNLNQASLAERAGLTQGAISRAVDPDYGNLTFNNVLKIASGLDVAFVGRFVPFSELAHWYTNLSEETLEVPSFNNDAMESEGPLNEALNIGAINANTILSSEYGMIGAAYFHSQTTQPSVGIQRKLAASTAEMMPSLPLAAIGGY